jgi:hypothetical protein
MSGEVMRTINSMTKNWWKTLFTLLIKAAIFVPEMIYLQIYLQTTGKVFENQRL